MRTQGTKEETVGVAIRVEAATAVNLDTMIHLEGVAAWVPARDRAHGTYQAKNTRSQDLDKEHWAVVDLLHRERQGPGWRIANPLRSSRSSRH